VSFVDYGNEEFKEKCDLFVLLPQFCSLPCQAIRCRLSAGSPGSAASRGVLEENLLAKTVKLIIKSKSDDDKYIVQLPECEDNISILEQIKG
jgi:hypothetical protein